MPYRWPAGGRRAAWRKLVSVIGLFSAVALVSAAWLFWRGARVAADEPPSAPSGSEASAETTLAARRAPLDATFARELEALAAKCEELALPDLAATTRGWRAPPDPRRRRVCLPPADDLTRPAADAPRVRWQWHEKFVALRRAQAARLHALTIELAEAGEAGEAFPLLYETLREDPDHAAARRALGYRREGDAWRQIGDEPSARAATTTHPVYRWPPGGHWRAESRHYTLATSAGADAARAALEELERLRCVWGQVFPTHAATPAALARVLRGAADPPAPPRRKHQIVLFRDHAEYVAALRALRPDIAISQGFYSDTARVAYLHAGEPAPKHVWRHEGAHQLFQETIPSAREVARDHNAWLIEGLALYFESARPGRDHVLLGGPDADRVQYARHHLADQQFYLPLEALSRLGRDDLRRHTEIRALYSQSAGLTHFLLDGENGRRRAALGELARRVYLGDDAPGDLAALTGAAFADLDRRYHHWLDVTDDDLARFPELAGQQNLSLGRTSVTDAGARALAACRRLEWLNLAHTRVTDATLAALPELPTLRRLNVESTGVGDDGLAGLAKFPNLESLDLSDTAVGDAGLRHVGKLVELRELWLTHCQVTDAGLAALAGLKKLRALETTGAKTTPAGLRDLRRALPLLEEK